MLTRPRFHSTATVVSCTPSEQAGGDARRALIGLCVTEIVSWGVLYYAFPVLLVSITRTTDWSPQAAMGAFSTGLIVSAVMGVPIGRLIDRYGPRRIMTAGALIGVVATLAMAGAPTLPWFYVAWIFVGLAQSAVLYPPAFAALTRWYGGDRRMRALTTVSLAAGLSSAIFVPATAVLLASVGWRATYAVLAIFLGAITVPVHVLCLTPPWPGGGHGVRRGDNEHVHAVVHSRAFALLATAMTLAAFGIYAATLNLIPLLTSQGTGSTLAATALAVCGAGQLIGRLGYPTLTHLTSPRMRAISIFTTAAITIALLGVVPSEVPALIAAAAAVGAARGAFTLLQATAISDRWGIRNFATLNGILVAPTTVAAALAPAGGALLAQWLSGYSAAFLAFAILALMGAFIGIASIPSQRRSVRAIPEHLSTTRHGLPQVQANAMQEGGSS